MTGISARVAEARRRLGISRQELERRAGVSKGYVSRLEAGKRGSSISAAQLDALASALEVAPRWLAEGAQASAPMASADPCPARTRAAVIALEGGASPVAVAHVLALPPDGRPVLAWIVAILEAQKNASHV